MSTGFGTIRYKMQKSMVDSPKYQANFLHSDIISAFADDIPKEKGRYAA